MNRRAILKGALGGVLSLTLPTFARYAFSQESPAIVPVREGFVMLTGAGGNVLVRTASAGQVLVDSGAAELTDAVLKRLRELPGAGRVTTVFNTHWHLEQVGRNLAFGRSAATSGSNTATCSKPTPTAISTYSSETRTCWPRVMPSRR